MGTERTTSSRHNNGKGKIARNDSSKTCKDHLRSSKREISF